MNRIAHVGIAVKDLEASINLFSSMLDREPEHREEVKDQNVLTAMFGTGETHIELLQATSEESAVARFIKKRGEGIHHLSFDVTDIRAELQRLKNAGYQLVDEEPRKGAGGCLVAFLHPKSTNGVLIELSQAME